MIKKMVVILTVFITVFAISANEKGTQIAKKYFDLKKPDDISANTKMVIIDKNGNQQIRSLKTFGKEGANGTNSFMEFVEPADVRGTKFLTLVESNGENVQRLYLPALKKVRCISSSNKDGKFMGSDLFYYDMEDHDMEDYDYELIAENQVIKTKQYEGMKFYIVKFIAKDPDSPYSYSQMWINMENHYIYKTIPYDKNGVAEKIVMNFEVKEIDGVLIATKTIVMNQKEKHNTILTIEGIKLNTGLKSSIFEVQNLK